jgi:quercetin dioxygenase-like cupin family protein
LTGTEDYFFTPADFGPEIELGDGVRIRVLARGSLMFSLVEIDDGVTTPTHGHPEEQMGFVLEGAFDRVQGDERRVLQKGDGFYVPPHVEHGGTATGGPCRLLDVFTPPRPRYLPGAQA